MALPSGLEPYVEPSLLPPGLESAADMDNAVIGPDGQPMPMGATPEAPGMLQSAANWAGDWRNWARLGTEAAVTTGLEALGGVPTAASGGLLSPAFLAAQPVIGAASYEAGNLMDALTGKEELAPLGERAKGMALAGAVQTAIPGAAGLMGAAERSLSVGPKQAFQEAVTPTIGYAERFGPTILNPEQVRAQKLADKGIYVGMSDSPGITKVLPSGVSDLIKDKSLRNINDWFDNALNNLELTFSRLSRPGVKAEAETAFAAKLPEALGGDLSTLVSTPRTEATIQQLRQWMADNGRAEAKSISPVSGKIREILNFYGNKQGGFAQRTAPDSQLYWLKTKGKNAEVGKIVVEEVRNPDGTVTINGWANGTGKMRSVTKTPADLTHGKGILNEAAGLFKGEADRVEKDITSGNLSLADVKRLQQWTTSYANTSQWGDLPTELKTILQDLRDNLLDDTKAINPKMEAAVNELKAVYSANRGGNKMLDILGNRKIIGQIDVDGRPVSFVRNPQALLDELNDPMNGLLKPFPRKGTYLLDDQQRAELQRFVDYLQDLRKDSKAAQKLLGKEDKTLLEVLEKQATRGAGLGWLGFGIVPSLGTILLPSAFDVLITHAVMNPQSVQRKVARGIGSVLGFGAKATSKALPAEVPRLDMFKKEKR